MPEAEGPLIGEAVYAVQVYYFGGRRGGRSFASGDPRARAEAFFAKVAADPNVIEVWLTRTDGPAPVIVARRGRRAPGGLVEPLDPAAEPVPDPTELAGPPITHTGADIANPSHTDADIVNPLHTHADIVHPTCTQADTPDPPRGDED